LLILFVLSNSIFVRAAVGYAVVVGVYSK